MKETPVAARVEDEIGIEAGGAECADRTAHMPGRRDQQPHQRDRHRHQGAQERLVSRRAAKSENQKSTKTQNQSWLA